jgi:hypothetical protein
MAPVKAIDSVKKRQFAIPKKKSIRNLEVRSCPRLRAESNSLRVELASNKLELAQQYSERVHDACCRRNIDCDLYSSYEIVSEDGIKMIDSNSFKSDLVAFYKKHLNYESLLSQVRREAITNCIVGYRKGDNRKVMHFTLHLGGKQRDCCKCCFVMAFEMTVASYKNIVKQCEIGYAGAGGDKYKSCTEDYRGSGLVSQGDMFHWLETETVDGGVSVEDANMVANAMCRMRPKSEQCQVWFQNYIVSSAEQSPEGTEIFVSVAYKSDLHDVYIEDMVALGYTVPQLLTVDQFLLHWRECFPNVMLRRDCTVIGKCATCAKLDAEGQKKGNCVETKEALKKGKMLHRLFYECERIAYQHRSAHSRLEKMILSMCIDIMESCDHQAPCGGTQCKFEQTLDVTYVGCLVHGVGLTMYRCTNLVGKSADIICHVVLDQIHKYMERNGCAPDACYVQNDGGGENANMCFFALLEYLVIKRFTHMILSTRFPTGHGHDDGDGAFGHVKRAWKRVVMKTWEAFRDILEKKHETSNYKTKMEDVNYVHDYWKFFENSFDKYLASFQKMQETQHQFQFEAVENDPWFPLGCKVKYSAFSAACNVEAVVLSDHAGAQTDLGMKIGIDFCRTYSKWYPLKDTFEGRPVDGFYLLKSIPTEPLKVKDWLEPDRLAMDKVRKYLSNTRHLTSEEKEEWATFFVNFLPVEGVPYAPQGITPFVPLQGFEGAPLPYRELSDRCIPFINGKVEVDVKEATLLALALPCVKSEWDQVPPKPRFFIPNTEEMSRPLEEYYLQVEIMIDHLKAQKRAASGCTELHMETKLFRFTNILGKELCKRPSGRAAKCNLVKALSKHFFNWMYAPVLSEVKMFMATILTTMYTSDEDKSKCIIRVAGVQLSKQLLRREMNAAIVDCVVNLFQTRDNQIAQKHQALYMDLTSSIYYPFKVSIFLTVDDGLMLLGGQSIVGRVERLQCIYIPYLYKISEEKSVWSLIVIDCTMRTYALVTPTTTCHTVHDLFMLTTKLNCVLQVDWPACFLFNTEGLNGIDRYVMDIDSMDESISWLYGVLYFVVYGLPIDVQKDMLPIQQLKLKYFLIHGKLFM